MPILNYTTKIDDHKTVGEIQALLSRKGANSVMVVYQDGSPQAVSFEFPVNRYPILFKLPCKFEGVRKAMLAEVKNPATRRRREKDRDFDEQVRRIAWRIVKDWVEAQLALVEAGQAEMSEVFLPYLVAPTGQTLYEAFKDDSPKLLAAINYSALPPPFEAR